jgi:hypothetical protein
MSLWAVVFPDEPAKIEAKLYPGQGEEVETILLRFAPAEVGKVFPKNTVDGQGDPWLRSEADRIFRHKVGWKWYTPAGNPTIVQSGWTLIDVETTSGERRFYGVDRGGGNIEYVADFEQKPLPALRSIERNDALGAFDEVWEAFDAEYAKFGRFKKLNWKKLRDEYRQLAGRSETTYRLAGVVADMLAQLALMRQKISSENVRECVSRGLSQPEPSGASFTGCEHWGVARKVPNGVLSRERNGFRRKLLTH